MDIFHITFFLSRCCLGEITPNFRRIYWTGSDNVITAHFFLEKEDDDISNIEYEIMPEFQMFIESEPCYKEYSVDFKIIVGNNLYLKEENFDISVELYRRKELFD